MFEQKKLSDLERYIEDTSYRIKVIELFDGQFKTDPQSTNSELIRLIRSICNTRHWDFIVRDASLITSADVNQLVDLLIELADSTSVEDQLFKRLVLIINVPENPDESLQKAFERLMEVNDDVYVFATFESSLYSRIFNTKYSMRYLADHFTLNAVSNSSTIITKPSDNLQQFLYENFPLVEKLPLDLSQLQNDSTIVKGSIYQHKNHHGTAFGGSIGLVLLMSAMCHLIKLIDQYREPLSFVIKHQAVEYSKPMDTDFLAESLPVNSDNTNRLFEQIEANGNGEIVIRSVLRNLTNKTRVYASLEATFYVKKQNLN
jgi:thioesterase domain-containing protein